MNPQDANMTSDAGPAEKSYPPFWALWIVFLTMACLQAAYLSNELRQQSRIEATLAEMKVPLAQSQAVNQTIEAIGRELLALSADSTEAAKIVAEFKIKLTEPAKPAK